MNSTKSVLKSIKRKTVKKKSLLEQERENIQKINYKLQKIINRILDEDYHDVKWRGKEPVFDHIYNYLNTKYQSKCKTVFPDPLLCYLDDTRDEYEEKINGFVNKYTTELYECIPKMTGDKPFILFFGIMGKIGHANILIFRYINEVIDIEHFEPHGSQYHRNNIEANKKIESFLIYFVNKLQSIFEPIRFRLLHSTQICPTYGLQSLQEKKKEILGTCLAWCIFFMELILSFPNIPSHIINQLIHDQMRDMTETDRGIFLTNLIKGYIYNIDRIFTKHYDTTIHNLATNEKRPPANMNSNEISEVTEYDNVNAPFSLNVISQSIMNQPVVSQPILNELKVGQTQKQSIQNTPVVENNVNNRIKKKPRNDEEYNDEDVSSITEVHHNKKTKISAGKRKTRKRNSYK
jgi:hypothetical protein